MSTSSETGLLGTQVVTQIGFIVKDIEQVSAAYAEFLGVEKPKWFWTDPAEIAQTEYKGDSCPARAKLAFFDCGQLQIELIEPDEHPSVWRDFLNEHGEGPHHIAFVIKGMKEKVLQLDGKGFPLLQKGEYTGGRYAYMDTSKELKVLVELLENDSD
ncbi:VOC family protein [Paenibacillus pinistramenti]|uniref:VOC family protein n=1 Tax=Paenibacillus pinistramenti TaxID=1768003 RepID=UPI001108D697|nr:VOC family protein [Paenibacillus pinistramenti]